MSRLLSYNALSKGSLTSRIVRYVGEVPQTRLSGACPAPDWGWCVHTAIPHEPPVFPCSLRYAAVCIGAEWRRMPQAQRDGPRRIMDFSINFGLPNWGFNRRGTQEQVYSKCNVGSISGWSPDQFVRLALCAVPTINFSKTSYPWDLRTPHLTNPRSLEPSRNLSVLLRVSRLWHEQLGLGLMEVGRLTLVATSR